MNRGTPFMMLLLAQLDALKQAMRQLADDKDASLEAELKPLCEKLAAAQQQLDATSAALKAAQAVGVPSYCTCQGH